jgi:hypothetical protein
MTVIASLNRANTGLKRPDIVLIAPVNALDATVKKPVPDVLSSGFTTPDINPTIAELKLPATAPIREPSEPEPSIVIDDAPLSKPPSVPL